MLCLLLALPALGQSYRYERIDVVGNARIDTESIIRMTGLPEAGTVSAGEINQAFRALSDRGVFQDISIVPRTGVLEVAVEEYPTVNEVRFEGNRRIKDKDLEAVISTKPRQVYLPSNAENDAATISLLYYSRGRFAASVNPVIIRRRDNRVDLVFEIAEGRVVEIERLSFVGNSAFSDRRLRRVLGTKQATFLRAFVQKDTYLAERLELDKTLLRDFYLANGYIDFEVESVTPELTRERDAFLITFLVNEGQKYSYGEITASSDIEEVDPEQFLEVSRIKTGRTFSPVTLQDSVGRLEFHATELGLNFIRVTPQTQINDDNTIDVNFFIDRGPRIIVERIDIEGNTTTLDRVIRREFQTVEGDPLNPEAISRAEARIQALGFFNQVEVTAREISPTQSVIRVDVDEALTGSLSFGVGYSKETKFSGKVSVTERNLLGRGQTLTFSLEAGSDSRDAYVSFFEPRLFDQDISFEGIVGWRKNSQNDDIVNVDEFTLYSSIGFPLNETSRLNLNFGYTDFSSTIYGGSSLILRNDVGPDAKHVTRQFSFGYSYVFNRIAQGYSPNSGIAGRFSQTVFLANGSHNTLRTTALITARSSPLGSDWVFSGTLEGGVVQSNGAGTKLIDRFQTNSKILKGFAPYGIGPRTLADSKALGGNYFAALRLEAQFPLGFADDAGVTGGLFFDMGSIWGLDQKVDIPACSTCTPARENDLLVDDSFKLRSSVGFSIFVDTLVGPLRLNFSRPVKIYDGDKKQNFELTISSSF